jgi:hypothetical protein
MSLSVRSVSFYPFSDEISMNSVGEKGVTCDFDLILLMEDKIEAVIDGLA